MTQALVEQRRVIYDPVAYEMSSSPDRVDASGMTVFSACRTKHAHRPRFHGRLKSSLMPLSGVIKITPRFYGHLKASLKPLSASGVIEITLPIETVRGL